MRSVFVPVEFNSKGIPDFHTDPDSGTAKAFHHEDEALDYGHLHGVSMVELSISADGQRELFADYVMEQ